METVNTILRYIERHKFHHFMSNQNPIHWPTLEDRLKHPLKTEEEALKQLKKFKMIIKQPTPTQKDIEKFIGG